MSNATVQGNVELPLGWEWTTLGNVVEQMSNGLTKRQSKEPVGVPVSRIQTISKGTIDLELVGYLPDVSTQEVEKYQLRQGDILFSHINSDLHLGKTALFNLDNTLLLHGMNLLLIRVNSERVLPKLVHYLFNHLRFFGYFMSIAQHAVNQSSINQAKMKAIPFPLPPVGEQRRIVEKIEELFTKLDAGVRSLEQARAQLKSYRRSVLKAAVEGELSREWREAHEGELEPASELLKRILQERREKFAAKKYKEPVSPDTLALPTLPDGWVWTTVSQLSTKVTDGVHRTPTYVDDGVPFLSVNNMSEKGTLSFSPCKYITRAEHQELYQRCNPNRDDVLLSKVGTVGLTAVVTTDVEFSLFVNTALIKPIYRHVSSRFLASSIRHGFAAGLYSRHVGGSNQKFIGTTKIGSLPTPLPPLAEQQVIVDELERRLSVVDKLEATVEENLKQAAGLRQSILKQAFSGELVPQDPGDEPASVLLKRIREEREAAKQKTGNGRKRNTAPAKSNHAEQGGLF